MRTKLKMLVACLICIYSTGFAQQTIGDQRSEEIFERAKELYHKHRYAAAQVQFVEYQLSGSSDLLKSDARYYIAACALALSSNDGIFLTDNFREMDPENTLNNYSRFDLGSYYFQAKKYQEALLEFIQIDPYFLTEPQSIQYSFMSGYSQFYLGNLNEAKPYFLEIIEKESPYYHLSNYFHSYIAFENNEFETALKGFKRLETHEDFKNFIPIYITEIYSLTGNYASVVEYGSKAMANSSLQKPHIIELLLAQAYFKLGNFHESYVNYKKYEQKRDLTADDYYQFGYASYIEKEYKLAATLFEKLTIQSDSLGQNVAYHLGDCYIKTNKKLEAKNSFAFAKDLAFDLKIQEDAFYHYAKLAYELKMEKECINAFQGFIARYPKSKYIDEAKENFTRILLLSNNYNQAFQIIEKLPDPTTKINEAYQRLAFNIGLEFFEIKDYQNARIYFNKSLTRPLNANFKALTHFWIGESLYKEERYDEAVVSYKNFTVIPESKGLNFYAIAHYNIGYCLINKELFKEAIYYFDEYFKLKNGIYTKQYNSDASLRLGDCNFASGIYQKAIDQYDQVIALNFSDVDYALYQKALIKGLQGKTQEKIDLMAEIIKKYRNSGLVDDALYEMATERFQIGNLQQSLRDFEYLIQDYPNSDYLKLAKMKTALIYYNLDQNEKALSTLLNVIADFPSSDESRGALSIIKNIYVELGKADSFFALIDTMTNIQTTNGFKDTTMFNSVLSVMKTGDCDKISATIDKYNKTFEHGIFTNQVNYYQADCKLQQGDFNGTLHSLDKIIAHKPNEYYNRSLVKAASLCFSRDSFSLAIPYLLLEEEITNGRQELLEIYEGLARCYLETENCDLAQAYIAKIEKYSEVSKSVLENAHYTLARCSLRKSEYQKALKLFNGITENNGSKLGAECQYLIAYIYYLQDNVDSSRLAILKVKDNYASYDYFVAKSFILMSDNFVKLGDDFNAKATLQSIIENFDGADLKKMAEQKLEAIKFREKQNLIEEQEKPANPQDTIEYNGN